jgi:hypothetical protein
LYRITGNPNLSSTDKLRDHIHNEENKKRRKKKMTNPLKNNKPFDAMTDTEKMYAVVKKILWGFKAFGVFITLWGGWTTVVGIGVYIVTEIALCALYPEDILESYNFWSKFRKSEEVVDTKDDETTSPASSQTESPKKSAWENVDIK